MPLRVLGGISRAELLKDRWVPVTRATTLQAIGNHVGALITAPGDYALIETMAPLGTMIITEAMLCLLTLSNTFAMLFNLDMDWGNPLPGEAYNNHTYSGVRSRNTVTNRLLYADITNALGGNLNPNDILGIRVTYNAGSGPDATNFYVLGVYIRWV